MPETLQDLYGKLEKANIKLPDYNTFEKKYSVEGGADVLYGKLNSANVKLPDLNTFKSKYFNSQENVQSVNPPAQTTEPAPTVTPTVEKPKWEATFEGVKTYKNNQSEDINLPVIPDARRSYTEVSTNSLGDILYGKTNEKTKPKNTELSFNENDPETLFKNQVRKLGVNVENLNTDDPSAIYFQNKASENYNKVLNTLDEIKNKTQLSQTGTTEDEVNAISEIVEDELLPIRNEKQAIINQLNSNKRSLQSIDTQNPQPGFLPDLQQEEEQKIFEQQKKDIYKQNEELENRLSAINREENNISGIFSQAVYANRSLNVETFKQNPNQILQLTQDKLIFGAIQDNINSSSLSDNIKRKAKLLNAQITNDGGKLLDVLSDRVYEDQPNEYANKTLGISKAELQKQGAEGIDKLLKFSQADVTQDMKALEKYKNLPKNFIESSIKSGEMTEEEAKQFIVDYNTQLEKVNSKLKAIKYIEDTGNQYFGDYKRFEYYKEKQNELAKNFNFRQDVVGAVQSGTFNNVLDAVDFGKTTATKAKSALGVISPEQEAAQYLKVASDQDFDYMRYTPDYFKTLQFITKDEKGENKINPRALGYAALKTTAESYMLYLTGLGITKATQLNRLKNYGKVGEYVADHIGIIPASELYIQPDMFNEAMKKYESGEISLDQVYNMSAAQAGIEGATEMWFLPEAKALKGVINNSTKELALNLFFKSKIGKDLVGSFGEKAVKAVWEGTKTGGGEAWEEVLGNIFNDQYNYQVRQNNPDYIYQEQNTLESNTETAINTFISMYPTILLGMGTSYRNNNSKATAQMAQYEVAQNPSQFNQYAKDFIDNTKNLNWYFPTQSKEEVYKEIVANNTKLSEVYNQAIPITSKLDSESEKIDYFNALNSFTTLSSKLNLTKEQEEELESASKKLISYKLKVATSDALREADPVKYNAAKIENFIDTTNYDIQDVTKLALLGKTLNNSLEEYKDKEGYETLVEKIQSKIDLVNENISKLENKSTSQEKVDLIQTPVVETVEKSLLEQTKEKISSLSKEELSSYNPLLDKTLSKEEKKEVYDLKLQRLQELEDTENTITFGNKTFKKGEQVTTDQGKTYWNLDGLTEDGRLKLSRTLVNKKTGQETSESSVISDPNDVSVYTKQTTPQEGEETEENVANIFLGQQEETSTDNIEAKKDDIEKKAYLLSKDYKDFGWLTEQEKNDYIESQNNSKNREEREKAYIKLRELYKLKVDKEFIDSIEKVHWVRNIESLISLLEKGKKIPFEISAEGYLNESFKSGWGNGIGVKLKGETLIASNEDLRSDNKYGSLENGDFRKYSYGDTTSIILNKDTFLPHRLLEFEQRGKKYQGHNEFLLKNSEIEAIVIDPTNEKLTEEFKLEVENIARKFGIPIIANTKYDAELKALEEQQSTSTAQTATAQSGVEAKKADIERRRQEVRRAIQKAGQGEGGQFAVTLLDGTKENAVRISLVGNELGIGNKGATIDLSIIKKVENPDGTVLYDAELKQLEQPTEVEEDVNAVIDESFKESLVEEVFPEHIYNQLAKLKNKGWLDKIKTSKDFNHFANSIKKNFGLTIGRNVSNPNSPDFKGELWTDEKLDVPFQELKSAFLSLDNPQTEVVTPQEVSGVKPQTAEKAEKEQEKEVVEKFTEPANPFKNGKVKTSNWNEAIEKIKDNISNYRVKVVNVKNIPFNDLPQHTKKTFEIDSKKQNKSIEEFQKTNNWKFLQIIEKTGEPLLVNGKPVYANFPDGSLLDYRDDSYYDGKLNLIKKSVKENPTLTIERISNFPVEITQDSNELSVAVGTNDFSIAKGSKGFPVAMLGSQEVNLISRKLTENELNTIVEIAFNFGSSGVYSQEAVKLTTEQKNNSERYQKLQYLKNLIFTGKGITTSGKKKLNFEYFLKSKNPEEFAKYGFSTKITYGNELVTSKKQLREILKNYSFNEINVNKDLSESLIKFTTYKIEDGKIVVDKPYPTYKDFLKDTIKTKGVSATKLQDNFYIEVGDTDNTLSAKLEEAKEETPVIPPVVTTTPTTNPEIVTNSPALDEFKDILNEKEKPIDPLIIDDDFTGLLRSRKLSQEATTEQNKKAKEWFSNSPLSKYISLNQLQNIVNSDAFASWNWGAINLFKGSQYADLYHEAWHEFSQLYLTKKQKEALYGEIKKANVIIELPSGKKIKSSEATNKQIEEYVAEDFRNYALSNGTLILNNKYQRNSIFRKIWNFLKEWVTGNTDIQTVYERLYAGNISKYKRDLNNAFWGNLNLGVTLADGKQLSDTDTKNLYRAIDSLIGTIFQQNGKPVTMMFGDNKVLSTVYGAIYKNLVNKRNVILKSIQDKAKQTNLSPEELQKLRIEQQTFYNLKDVTDNWNKIIQEHRQYSAFFNISKDRIKLDEEGNIISIDDKFTEETDEGNDRNSELIKNENVSSKEMASNETIFTIATLPKYNPDGTKAVNPFFPFVQDIVDFNSTWDKLTTATNNHLEYSQVLSQIEKLGKTDKSFQDLINRLPNSEKSLTDDEQRMKGAFMNDISKPLVQVYELIMSPMNGKMMFSYKTAASSDLDKIKRQWNDNFESTSPFIKQNPDDSLYTDKEEIISTYGAKGSKPAFYYNKQDYEKADKKQMFENRIDFLSKIGITFTEDILSDIEFQDLITKDFVKTPWTKHSSTFSLYELITKAKDDISSLTQLSKVKPASEFNYFAKSIEELANYELLGSNNLFAQSVKNAEQNNVWQIRQWNYITKIFNALNDVEKYPTYQDLIGLDSETGEAKNSWLQQFNFEANPYVKGIYLNTLFDLNTESPTFGQRRVIKKGNKTIYPTISLHDYNGMRLNLADNKTNEGKGTTSLTAFEKIVQNINSLLLFNTQENLRYGDKSSSFSTVISHYVNKSGKLEERKAIIPFESFINNREAIVLPQEAFKYLVADLRQEIIPMARFENEQIGSNLKYYNKNITDFGTFDGILTKETKDAIKKQIIKPNIQDSKEIDRILATLPLKEEFENYIQTKSEQLSDLLDTQGILEDTDIFDPKIIEEKVKTPEGQTISQPLPKQSMLYGYIVNSLLYNIEHTKLISFDPRFYKNPKNVIKRLSAWSATGNIFIVDEQTNNFIDDKKNLIKDAVAKKLNIKIPKIFSDGKIRSVISKDNEYSANKLLENYKEKFLATGKYTSEQLQTILKAYSNVNEADGQGHITLDLLRESKLRAGSSHWTKAHQAAYEKEAKFLAGESTEGMSSEEAMTLFPPQKWQYAGIGLWNGWLPYPVFYKFSVVPLIPSAIKNTPFEEIHDNLVRQNVGLHLFESGSKASGALNENGQYNPFYSDYEKRTPYLGEYTINTVFFQYLKEQVNVDPKLKEEVSFSTQMRKLLHLNLFNNGVPNDVKLSAKEWNKLSKSEKLKQSPIYKSEQRFGDVIENIVKIEQESILRKMGATKQEDGNYKLDAEKLAEFFKEEFIKRDLPNEVVNYLQAFEGEFLFPIDAFKQRATIERIAYSIANKKLVQQKITGEALVQVASTGFEITDKFSSVREDSDLPFYTEPGKAQKIKIAFTSRWKPLLNLEYKGKKIGKLEVLNEAIKDEEWLEQNRRAISIVGVRIPVQGLNSQEFMEVFHFLPESMGAVIVVSPALVAKSGGDFDIDKLTTFFPNLFQNKFTGEVKLYNSKDLKFTDIELVQKLKELKKPSQSKLNEYFKIRKELSQELANYKEQRENIKLTKQETKTAIRKLDVEIALWNEQLELLEEIEYAFINPQDAATVASKIYLQEGVEKEINLQDAATSAIEQSKLKLQEKINDALITQKFFLKSINESLKDLREDINYTKLNIQNIDKSINPIKEYLSNIQELIYQSSAKKAYENELIDIIRETLSRPDNFLQLIRPNDTDLLNNKEYGAEKLKQMFVNAYQDDTFTSVVDFASILEAFKSNLVGKSNLGIAAVNNVLFALAQRAGLHHNETFTYRNTSGKMIKKPVEFYLPHNTVEVDGKELVSLAGLFSKDSNNYISDIISQYINGFVDVANDDWVFFIGAVKEFVPTMLYTAMAGTNAKTSIAFFNQPIMREYIKNIDKYKNLFTRLKDPKAYTNGNWKALEDAVYKYIKQDDELSQIFEEESLKERGLPFIKVRDYVKENVSPSFLTEERLSDALYNDNTLSPKEQIFLIFHFWELKRQSGILTNLQRSLNADTKKMGNGYSSIERQTMFDDVLKSNLFNADAMYRMRNESTIKAFTNDKTGFDTFSQQLFTDLFEITNHPTFNKVIRELINNDKELNFEFKFSKIEKLVNTIKNDFITYLYQNQVLDGNDNLFKKTQPLFNPKSSMALELKNIKEKYSNLAKEFPILDLIIPDNLKAGNTILKTNLKLKSRLADKDELDNAVLQIRQLQTFNSPKYTPEQQIEIQQFTDRLIKFIIVQSGLNPSVYNLLDIVPNEAYTQNIKSIIKDVQNVLNKDINIPFALKIDKKSNSQKSLERFYNRFRIENPAFYKFEPTDEELNLNFLNQRGKNYYLPTTDITGAKAKAIEDKLLAYIPTLPSKSVTVDKNNGQTLKQNPKSLFIVYDNEKEDNKKALSSMKITNFVTITATSIEAMERQIDEIISKSMGYNTISFNTAKGYFQDVKESNPELFNYGSQRLKDRFGITNLGFEEVPMEQEVIEQPIQNKEGIDFVFNSNPELAKIGSKEQYSQYLESLNKPNTNPILQGNQEEQVKKFAELEERLNNKEFLEGAKSAYESSKGLQQLGTQEEYNDYIARVSLGIVKNPTSGGYNYTSKVKDIVYHGTDLEKDVIDFKSDRGGVFLASTPIYASYFSEQDNAFPAIINFKNSYLAKQLTDNIGKTEVEQIKLKGFDSVIGKGGVSKMKQHENDLEYVAFQPEQIHILGSKQDIEGFKKFVEQPINKEIKEEFVNHSGGAIGSDSEWENIGNEFGVKSQPYSFRGHSQQSKNPVILTSAQLSEANEHLKKANETLKRRFPASSEYVNNLLRRNWYQVKNSKVIYAIGNLSNDNKTVEGGTGWAVQMAIDNDKTVFLFNQKDNTWWYYDNTRGTFGVYKDTPILTNNFAGIGTREITEKGKQAIRNVYEKTFNKTQEQPIVEETKEEDGCITPF